MTGRTRKIMYDRKETNGGKTGKTGNIRYDRKETIVGKAVRTRENMKMKEDRQEKDNRDGRQDTSV